MLYRKQAIVKRTMLSNSKQHSQKKIQADVAKATTEECKQDSAARRLKMRTKDILLIQMMEWEEL